MIDDLTWSAGRHEGLRTTELFATPLVVVFATAHHLAGRDAVPWSDLAPEPQVTEHRASVFARSVEAESRRAGFEPRVHARVHDAGAMLALVEGGDMIAVLPELAVTGQPHDVLWRQLTPTVERRLVAVTRVGHEHLPAARELVDELSQLTAEAVRPDRAAPR